MNTHVANLTPSLAALASAFAWAMHWMPGAASLVVSLLAIGYYVLQIQATPWWRMRRQRALRRKMRRERLTQRA